MTHGDLQNALVDANIEIEQLKLALRQANLKLHSIESRVKILINQETELMESVSKSGIAILHYERNIKNLNEIIKD